MLSNLKSYKRKLEERKCERLKLEQDLDNLEEKQNTTDTSSNNGLSSQLESESNLNLTNVCFITNLLIRFKLKFF